MKKERAWYYLKENKKVGPIPESKIQELLDKGDLSPEALVWSDDLAEWTPASKVGCFRVRSKDSVYAPKNFDELSRDLDSE